MHTNEATIHHTIVPHRKLIVSQPVPTLTDADKAQLLLFPPPVLPDYVTTYLNADANLHRVKRELADLGKVSRVVGSSNWPQSSRLLSLARSLSCSLFLSLVRLLSLARLLDLFHACSLLLS